MHSSYLVVKKFRGCFNGKFSCSNVLLFYLEAIYLPVLKSFVHMHEMCQMNCLWLTQISLYHWYIRDLRWLGTVCPRLFLADSSTHAREINAGIKRNPNKTINIVVVRKNLPTTFRFSVFKRAECSSSLNLFRVDKKFLLRNRSISYCQENCVFLTTPI